MARSFSAGLNGHFVIAPLPPGILRPEECKTNGSALVRGNRNVQEVARQSNCHRLRIVRCTPFIRGPAQPESRGRLNSQGPPRFYRSGAPVGFPYLQLLALRAISK